MKTKNEMTWLCENAGRLERFSGQWVLFNPGDGVMQKGVSLESVLKRSSRHHTQHDFIFHVPSKEEVDRPLPLKKHK